MRFLNEDTAMSSRWIPGASLTVFTTVAATMAEARRPNRIDVHHHFYPPEYLAVMGDVAKRRVVRDWTVARSLEKMDKSDIRAAVLSLSPPGLHHLGLEQMRLLARTVNEHEAMDAIYHGNAEALLPRLRSKAHERT